MNAEGLNQVRPPVIHDFGFLVNGAAPKPAPIQISTLR